ncbi:MAG: TIR domain-containing protein, partial [Pseudomonadota bacterium]
MGALRSRSKAVDRATDHLVVFISYARKESDIAERVREALQAKDIDVLIDQHDLPYGELWRQQLEEMIRKADTIIWLVSEASIRSKDCLWEISKLKELNKRLVPIKIGEVQAGELPELIGERQMMSLMPTDDFDIQLTELADTLKIPLKWVKLHTQFADQARRKVRLRGKELKEAIEWLGTKPDSAEPPTDDILSLIAKSRRAAAIWMNLTIIASLLLTAGAFAVAWYSDSQRRTAERAESKALSLVSERATDEGNAATGLLLALEALPDIKTGRKRLADVGAQRALYKALFSLRERAVLSKHDGAVTYAEASADGRFVVTASRDGRARLWDGQGNYLRVLEGHQGPVNMARFSPDATRLVTVSDDRTAILWDRQGQRIATLSQHREPVLSVTFSDDGLIFATTSADYTARLWAAADGRHLRGFKGHGQPVVDVDISPDGRHLATASADGTGRIWRLDGNGEPLVLEGHDDRLRSITFSPDGQMVATTSRDERALLWSVEGELLRVLDGHEGVVNRLAFDPSSQMLVTASDDNTAKVWQASTGEIIETLRTHQARVISAEFSRDGSKLLTASIDGMIGLWHADGDAIGLIATLKGHEREIAAAKFVGDGDVVVSSGNDGTARLWRGEREPPFSRAYEHDCDVRALAFRPDGQRMLTVCKGGAIHLWDTDEHGLLHTAKAPTPIISIGLSPDGSQAALAHEDGSVSLWDASTLAPIGEPWWAHDMRVRSVAFGPDGRSLLTSSADGSARLWTSDSSTRILEFNGHKERVRNAVFSPDGITILTVSEDRTAKLWDGTDGRPL